MEVSNVLRNSSAWPRGDFGLHDHLVARQLGQQRAQLHFGGAVAAGGFNVIDAQFQGPMNTRLQVFLVCARDVLGRHILPFVLIAHAATGDDGDLQIGPAKATVFHWGKNTVGGAGWQASLCEMAEFIKNDEGKIGFGSKSR